MKDINLGKVVGSTPCIGENGNWFIDNVDTGVCANVEMLREKAGGVASLDNTLLIPRKQLPLASVGSGAANPAGDGGRGAVKITVSGSVAYIWTT